MAGLKTWIISLIAIGLFSIALIGYAINFANDNDSFIDVSDDEQINELVTGTKQNLSSFSSAEESTYASIANSTVAAGSQTTSSSGAFAITPPSAVGVSKNIFLIGYTKVFGSGQGFGLFLITLFSIFSFITILYVWKAWVGGAPE